MSRQARRRRERRKTRWGVATAIAGGLVLLTLVVLGQSQDAAKDDDHCLVGAQPAAQAVVLLDPSDELSGVQQLSAAPRVIDALEGLPESAEIRVYAVARAGRGDAAPEYRICKPRDPAGIGRLESLWVNRDLARRRYRREFLDPVEEALGALLGAAGDTASPIVEAIQTASVDAFQPRDAAIERHLLMVSDMVQHSADLSFFRETPDFGAFAGDPAYQTLRVDLDGAEATVFLLARRDRAGRIQGARLEAFWEDYFVDQEADLRARPRWVLVEG